MYVRQALQPANDTKDQELKQRKYHKVNNLKNKPQ